MDLGPDVIGRLCAAMQRARLTLRYPREQVVAMVRQYTGAHWAEEANFKAVPCNLIDLYVDIVGRKLIADNPRVMLSTDDDENRPVIHAMEAWANKQIVKEGIADTLERCAINALFSIGICKVGIATPADAANEAWNLQAGDPFCKSIDLDDFVFDVHARSFSEVSFIGHRYRAPLEVVRRSKAFKGGEDVQASEDKLFNMEGDERLNVLGRGFYGDYDEFEDMIDLWEVYLPRHKLIVTLLEDNLSGAAARSDSKYFNKPLRVQKWLGPDNGPYHILGFGWVPGNPMPKAPIQDLYDLHMAVNNILRKLLRQAERQKEVLPVGAQQSADGSHLIETNDGEAFRCDGESPKPVSYGGPSPANFQLFGAMKDLYMMMGGNLAELGGLSPEAKTLGQERLLAGSSSATITSMQNQMINFTSSVMEAMCWFWYHHPQKVMKSKYQFPGLGKMGLNRAVGPRGSKDHALARNMPFDQLDVKVDPYSMPQQTPQEKLTALQGILTTVYMPMAQMFQQQGIQFDANEFFSLVSTWMNMPEIKQLLTMAVPPQQEGGTAGTSAAPPGPGGETGPQPAETTRHYMRHSQGNASAFGKDLSRANAMKGVPSPNGQPQGAGMA